MRPPEKEPQTGKPGVEKFAKLVALLKEYPGRNAIELQHLGYRPETHGDLIEAQKAGLIVWVKDKWFAVEPKGREAEREYDAPASANEGRGLMTHENLGIVADPGWEADPSTLPLDVVLLAGGSHLI